MIVEMRDRANLMDPLVVLVRSPSLGKCRKATAPSDGGFVAFQSCFPYLCESETKSKCPTIAQLSQPCLPVTSDGPTRVLHHLYLGSQQDVLDEEVLRRNGINYVLNISQTCPAPDYIPKSHFLRIPIKDNYGESILTWLDEALRFIDKVKSANGKVIVHCLAGISRSPTVAIAYLMKNMQMSHEGAYKFVKDKRPTISPNFNFLGQLIEFEKELKKSDEPMCSKGKNPELPTRSASDHEIVCARPISPSKPECAKENSAKPLLLKPNTLTDFTSKKLSKAGMELKLSDVAALSERKTGSLKFRSKGLNRVMPLGCSPPQLILSDHSNTSTSSKSHKRSMSEKEGTSLAVTSGEVKMSNSAPPSPVQGPSSIPRPAGLNLQTITSCGPVFVTSPPDTPGSKKPRSGNTTPVGMVQLEWGTSHLSMNSPVHLQNPFVEACARFAESRVRDEPRYSKVVEDQETTSSPLDRIDDCRTEREDILGVRGRSPSFQGHVQNIPQGDISPKDPNMCKSSSDAQKTDSTVTDCLPTWTKSLDLTTKVPSKDSPKLSGKVSLQRCLIKNLNFPHHLKLKVKLGSGDKSNSSLPSPTDSMYSRQTSNQSYCSESSASSGISPSLDSDASSILERHSSVSSGISPDFPSSSLASTGSPSKGPPTYPTTSRGFSPSKLNPFHFPRNEGDELQLDNLGESALQKRLDLGCSRSEENSPHRAPTTAMDRVGTYYTKCKFDAEDKSDSMDSLDTLAYSNRQCNTSKTDRVLSVRSQSCEEISSSCAREAVVSEIVRTSRESLLQYGIARFEDEEENFETCSLSSQRSLSSSCEMIEVS